MTAYVVFIKEKTLDQHELDIYAQKMPAVLARFPVTFLSAYGRIAVLEGASPEGVILVSFPTFDEATSWYHSEEYQAVARHRHNGAKFSGFVIEGAEV